MMKYSLGFLFFVFTSLGLSQQLSLEDVWKSNKLSPKMLAQLQSMKDGEHYTEMAVDKDIYKLNKYSYKTQSFVATLVSSDEISKPSRFLTYKFSEDESKVILADELQHIYRRSAKGKYYTVDLKTKESQLIYDGLIQEPEFSPDGNKVSYVFENNIYIKDLSSGEISAVTTDGVVNEIINGITDWVYEEEFAFVKAYHWNPTGEYLVFLRFDEREVPRFSMDIYGKDLYPSTSKFRYPKAGENNSKVTLHIYQLSKEKTAQITWDNYYYIPRLKWTNDPYKISIQTLNRHQNNLSLVFLNIKSGEVDLILNEKDTAYVDVTDDLVFLDNNRFLWTSERDGYRHVYLYSDKGKMLAQVTKGDFEVTKVYGYDSKKEFLYYQSTSRGPIYRDIHMTSLNRRKQKQLTEVRGTHDGYFSADMSFYIDAYSSHQTPPIYTLYELPSNKNLKVILNNEEYLQGLKSYNLPQKEYFTLNVNGAEVNVWMLRPRNFDANKKYPLFITQYSGPGSQMVSYKWHNANDFWYMMLAQKGYVVACMDGRGTGYKGAEFKKITYKQLGKYEVDDQIEFARQLAKRKYIDPSRIGIWGWSYGGFMSSNCLFKGADVFKMAIAVAPVTSWRFYDSIYTERYMQTPQENPGGYDENSPLSHVKELKGDFLLIHGSGDDNVHVQNSMRMVEALIQEDKNFDWAIYPDKNHGIYGGSTRLHLFRKMTKFIEEKL